MLLAVPFLFSLRRIYIQSIKFANLEDNYGFKNVLSNCMLKVNILSLDIKKLREVMKYCFQITGYAQILDMIFHWAGNMKSDFYMRKLIVLF